MDHNFPQRTASSTLDARVRKTREGLRAALLSLLEDRPFDEITIREICGKAGAGYATFFRHYPDKTTLLDDLAADEIRDLLGQAMPILYAVDSRTSCRALCDYVAGHRRLWSALLTGGAAGTLRAEFLRQARTLVPADAPPGGWLPTDLAVTFGVSGAIQVLAWWLEQGEDFPVERVAEILDRLVVTPALNPGAINKPDGLSSS